MTEEEVRALYDEASAAYSSGDYKRAGEMFSSLLIEPQALAGSNEIHWNYAMCLAFEGNWPLAIEHVQAGGYDVAQFRETCRQSNLRDAQGDFEAAAQLFAQEQWDQAANAFAELLIHPGIAADMMDELQWNIALCSAHLGDWDNAFGHIRASGGDEQAFRETATRRGLQPPEA